MFFYPMYEDFTLEADLFMKLSPWFKDTPLLAYAKGKAHENYREMIRLE